MFDTIIIGLGAMGSAAAYHLACRGQRVLGIDRFSPPHTQGSSHGQTRIIREAYFEHPLYVPLLQRAYELWGDLQERVGEQLLQITGGLMIGPPHGILFPGAKASAEKHALPHEIWSASEIRRRFPALQPSDDLQALWEPRAGILSPERCIAQHLALATSCGAQLRVEEPVLGWEANSAGFEILTAKGRYAGAKVLLTAGSWIGSLVPELRLPLTIERQVLFWFEPKSNRAVFEASRCPIHLWETPEQDFFYGFPDLGEGVKLARHHSGIETTAETLDRTVHPADETAMRRLAARFLPGANGGLRSAAVCMYTNTPDSHFWIDAHPEHPGLLIGSPCSGHGFKFASVMGEILADHLMGRRSPFDLTLFRRR